MLSPVIFVFPHGLCQNVYPGDAITSEWGQLAPPAPSTISVERGHAPCVTTYTDVWRILPYTGAAFDDGVGPACHVAVR